MVTGTTAHPWPTQMASVGHALTAFLPTAPGYDNYEFTPPNLTSTFYGRLSALGGDSGRSVHQLAAVSNDHRTVCADPCISSHIFSVALHISPREPAAFLPTSLKLQESTKDNFQNTNISRRVLDITGPGKKCACYSPPGRRHYSAEYATLRKRIFNNNETSLKTNNEEKLSVDLSWLCCFCFYRPSLQPCQVNHDFLGPKLLFDTTLCDEKGLQPDGCFLFSLQRQRQLKEIGDSPFVQVSPALYHTSPT